MGDLKSNTAIKFKGVLFLFLGMISGGLLLGRSWNWLNLLLFSIAIWAFCRFYYFAFYVLHHYVDPDYNYAGLIDLFKYLGGVKRKD